MKAGRQQGALDALHAVHGQAEAAAGAIGRAVELSDQLRAALATEVDAIALRLVELAHVAKAAADVHTQAQRLRIGSKA